MVEREISPLDGRYRERLSVLPTYFSEHALMGARCEVELRWLEAIDRLDLFPPLSEEERARIAAAREGLTDGDLLRIAAIEREIAHDVKAVELFLRERLALAHPERIHFALTSADVNNLAYGLLLMRFRDEQQLPRLRALIELLAERVASWKSVVFPARTHGQPASPTTLGKELAVFLSRLVRQARQLEEHRFRGKLTGATGTHAAASVAFPDQDWVRHTSDFVASLGLEPNGCTTQIEDHDRLAEYLAIVSRVNNIVCDLDRDVWEYLSRGDLFQLPADGEVGSSTMPHKVNPIRFENSEGNIAVANALLHMFCDQLTRSRMQRDLSDTTVKRNLGVALAHSHLAIDQTTAGLRRLDADPSGLRRTVDAAPEVLAEAYQTMLRAAGVADPYERLRGLTRGAGISLDQLHRFADSLSIPDEVKQRLRALRPSGYIGRSEEICDAVLEDARAWLDESPTSGSRGGRGKARTAGHTDRPS